jgi:GH15 family glucan-1,4-alpha-glucosidase
MNSPASTKSAPRGRRPTPDDALALRIDGYLPIGAYAAIGDSRSLALVGHDGTIDWLCLPALDSPSVFGALLDPGRGGQFLLQPEVAFTSERRYVERTNVLETVFHTDGGSVRITDALTIDNSQAAPWRELVRRIEGLAGSVPMRWRLEPRFGYGQRPASFDRGHDTFVTRDGALQIAFRAWQAGDPEVSQGAVTGGFTTSEGGAGLLAMMAAEDATLPVPDRERLERRLRDTVDVWRSWVSRHTYEGPWTAAVERSLLAIRLLADARSGAITAAGTTSLPEVLDGQRNFDYRFGWTRDLCFTLDALLAVGMEELTQSSIDWLLSASEHTHPRVDPVYGLTGDVVRGQTQLPLAGYRHTTPVNLGNNAGSQLQLGGFGDLLETVHQYVAQGHLLAPQTGARLADMADLLTRIWRREDSGLWELGTRAQYGTSKLGSWVALDRLLRLARDGHVPARHPARWQRARDEIRAYIDADLFSEAKNSYRLKAGSDELDCGMLLAARRGFGDPAGARMNGTIDAIRDELAAGGPLLYRYTGMQEQENAFLACTFWMVEALALAGRHEEAAELMQDAVPLANDVGLYSEELEPGSGELRGNFPQALTHLSLISAAHSLTPGTHAPDRSSRSAPDARS